MANLGKQADMAKARAWSNDPYQLPWRKAVFKGTPRRVKTVQERFDSKLLPGPGDCWAWAGAHFKATGYALFTVRSERDGKWRPTVAHRIAYQLYIAEIPVGLVLDHLCGNRACVNPWHLEPVPIGENVRRGWLALSDADRYPSWTFTPDWQGRCNRGHLITPETVVTRKNGKRECRECVRARDRARNANGGRAEHYAAMYRKRKAAAASR